MLPLRRSYAVLSFTALLGGCAASDGTVDPRPGLVEPGSPALASLSSGPATRLINVMDACDGPSFNAAIGPGTCARAHGVPFNEFIAQLTAHQSADAWHSAPTQTDAWLGDALLAVNKGGEQHTFTRVAQFGGGFIDLLNQLSGTPHPAAECLNLPPTEFMSPGGTDTETLDTVGDVNYQCCIHPWMRTVVHVKAH